MPVDNYTVLTHEVSTSVNMSHTKTGRLHNSGLYTHAKAPVPSTCDYAIEDIRSFLFATLILRQVQG